MCEMCQAVLCVKSDKEMRWMFAWEISVPALSLRDTKFAQVLRVGQIQHLCILTLLCVEHECSTFPCCLRAQV